MGSVTNVGRCRWCGAPILWRRNDKTGKAAPIDPEPVPEGPIVLAGDDAYHVLGRAERAAPWATGQPRFANHWQTCERRDEVREAYRR